MKKVIEFASDLKITIIKDSKICIIEIDNPDWNFIMKYIADGNRKMQIERKDLLKTDEKFFRTLIKKTYKENKRFI